MSKQTNILPDNPQIEIIKSSKTGLFTNYIFKAIPLAFDESMSYYETLCGLLHYLKNTIIPTVNNNADAVSELQTLYEELRTYVDDYFKGLDVQEEINNKLDEMVEDGTLEGVFINQSNDTKYIRSNSDITDILNNLDDNETLVLQKGDYICNNAEITNDNISIICEDGVTITTSQTAFVVSGNNFHMKGGKLIGPAEWYPSTSVDLYGVIEIENNSNFENVSFYNISKIGLYVKNAVSCKNCKFIGNMPSTYYEATSVNNQVFGLYIKADTYYNKTSNIINCEFSDLIEGIYFGDYNYPVTIYSVLINDCVFKNLYDHSCYINGGKAGIISNCISHYSNHAFVMMGSDHSILNNTVYLPIGDNNIEVTGISLREPLNGKIIGNTINGNGITGTSGIMLQNLSGDPVPNTVIENVIISENIFKSTGSITPVRIGNSSQTTSINNLNISNNIFDCENNPNRSFISFEVSGVTNTLISNNNFTLYGLFGYGINVAGGEVSIIGNTFNIKNMTANAQTNQNLINGSISGKIQNNKITLENSSLTNINLQLVRLTATNYLVIENNLLPQNAILLANIAAIWNNSIAIKNNIVGNNYCKGKFTTNATGALSITNKNFIGGITDVIIKPSNQNSAIYDNYYITSSNGSNTFNVFTTNVNTNIDLDYFII